MSMRFHKMGMKKKSGALCLDWAPSKSKPVNILSELMELILKQPYAKNSNWWGKSIRYTQGDIYCLISLLIWRLLLGEITGKKLSQLIDCSAKMLFWRPTVQL
jgi:hypothetical protein